MYVTLLHVSLFVVYLFNESESSLFGLIPQTDIEQMLFCSVTDPDVMTRRQAIVQWLHLTKSAVQSLDPLV